MYIFCGLVLNEHIPSYRNMGHLSPLLSPCIIYTLLLSSATHLTLLYVCGNHLHLEELYQKYVSLKMVGAMGYCGLAGSKRMRTCEDGLDGKVVELFGC